MVTMDYIDKSVDKFPLNAEEYSEKNGVMKIYLPDGHLEDSGGRDIWSYTNLPYPTKNDNEMIVFEKKQISNAGYQNEVEKIVIVMRRPQNIPCTLKKYGIGISGSDFTADRLEIPVINGHTGDDEYFEEELSDKGITLLRRVGFRPVDLMFAFMNDSNVKNYEDIREFSQYLKNNNQKLSIATEFPYLTEISLEKLSKIYDKNSYEIETTDGKTEPFVRAGDTTGVMDVVETGKSMENNGLYPVLPAVIESSPLLMVNTSTYNNFIYTIDEINYRVGEGMNKMKNEHPEYFEKKFQKELFE